MTRAQRRVHLVIWLVLGPALLSAIVLTGFLARDGQSGASTSGPTEVDR